MRNKTKTHLMPHHNPLSKSNLLITGQIQVDIRQLQAKRFRKHISFRKAFVSVHFLGEKIAPL